VKPQSCLFFDHEHPVIKLYNKHAYTTIGCYL